MMYFAVKKVSVLKSYQLLLIFETGEQKQFDMTPYLELGIFRELKDEALFDTVKVSFDSIEWHNGADFDPEVLYSQGKSV